MRTVALASAAIILMLYGASAFAIPISDGFDPPVQAIGGTNWTNAQDFGVSCHLGEDWNWGSGYDDYGKSVYAVSHGTVSFVQDISYSNSWGKCIILAHQLPDGSRVSTLYAHLSAIRVSQGNNVTKGQDIGAVGDSNGYWPSHLHFELRVSDALDRTLGVGYKCPAPGGWTDPSDFIDAHRTLCTAANVNWTSTPAENQWYRTDQRLNYHVDGSDPINIQKGANPPGYVWGGGRDDGMNLSDAGQGWHDYWVHAWNGCGDVTRHWSGGWDTVVPSTNFSGPATSTWLPGGSAVAWNPSDGTSGISSSSFGWDNGSTSGQVPEGVHQVTVSATDRAGNSVTETHGPYWLDTIAPVASLTGPATSTWFSTQQSVTWTATDATSGVATKALTWDSGPVATASPAAIPEGKRTASVNATDNAGNTASQNFGQWWIDTTPPVPSVEFSPAVPNGENGWYTSNPAMSVVAIDPNGADGSGVDARFYSLDGGAETPFTVPVTVSGDGIHTYSARATDVAGNSGSTGNLIVNVDTTAPVFDAIYTDTESRSMSVLVATWSCSDPDSGIAEYEYWIGTTAGDDDVRGVTSAGSNNWAYAVNLNLTPGATYYITVRAKNVAGLWSGVVTSQGILAVQGGYDAAPTFNSGGVSVTNEGRASTNYRIVDSIGQFVVASSESASFVIEHGYWHSDLSIPRAASPGAAKAIENGRTIELASADSPVVVTSGTSTFADRFYVEALDKSSGIACQYGAAGGPALIEGDRVSLIGKLNTIAGERMIQFASPTIVGHDDPPQPLFMVVPNLGGGAFNEWTPGVLDGVGLNNVGLLVKTYGGLVSYRDDPLGRFFYVDNGDNLYDGFGYGVRVVCDGFVGNGKLAMPAYGKTVIVTGISSVVMIGSQPVRAMRPRRQSDIRELP